MLMTRMVLFLMIFLGDFFMTIYSVARQVNLGCKLRSREWKDGRVDAETATDAPRRTYLEAVKRMISESLSRLGAIIDRLEQSGEHLHPGGGSVPADRR